MAAMPSNMSVSESVDRTKHWS